MQQPETCFATVGEDRVAYQVLGDGPVDLVVSAGQWGHVDLDWELASVSRFLCRLASFSRLIRFDPRGSGLSDPRPDNDAEMARYWAEDLLAVLDAVGSQSPTILTWIDGGMLALPFALNYPERVRQLVLFNTVASYVAAPDYPQGNPPHLTERYLDFTRKFYGTDRWSLTNCPSLAEDPVALGELSKMCRAMRSPKMAAQSFVQQQSMNVRPILGQIRVPTLVMGRTDCKWAPLAQTRYVAEHVSGARFVEFSGVDMMPFYETPELILGHIEEFVTGRRQGRATERTLLTVLFTDIVDSTPLAAELGDIQWHALLNRHDQITREQIALYGGTLIERTGDGTLATFDRPGSAIDCAQALQQQAAASLKVKLRAGLHTAEVEMREDGRVGGIGVHVGARVMAKAAAGEVLVTHTVQSILLGSGYDFAESGSHELKGVPGMWPLYAVGGNV